MHPATLIDPASRLRLEGAIYEAERNSQGELVLVVAERCDEYGAARWRFAVAIAVLAFLTLLLFGPPVPSWGLLVAQAAAFLLAFVAARWEPLLRLLIPHAICDARVDARARRAFFEQGLHRTRHQTGVLLYLALFEQRFVVLGDSAVDRALGPDESWDEIVSLATQSLRSGDPVAGLVEAIGRCAAWMVRALPVESDNRDELPNQIVLENRLGVVFEERP